MVNELVEEASIARLLASLGLSNPDTRGQTNPEDSGQPGGVSYRKPPQIQRIYINITHTLHVCHIRLHWGGFEGQCRHIWHTWSVWVMYTQFNPKIC